MPNWIRHTDKPEKKIYYRHEEGVKSMSLYIEGVIDAPLMNLLLVLAEVELFKTFIPMIKESRMEGDYSHLRKMAYF